MEIDEFNTDDHYIYHSGQESLRRNEFLRRNSHQKSLKYSTWVQPQKQQNNLFVSKANHSISQQSKPVPQPLMTRKLNWQVVWRLTTSSRTNIIKDILWITGDWNAKVGSQEISRIRSKFGLGVQIEAGQKLTEFVKRTCWSCPFPTTQKMDITRWSIPNWNLLCLFQAKMGKLYIINKNKTRTWLWLRW